jgi:hypothetical protein
MLCQFQDMLGAPGVGIHRPRVPGTDTAAADYALTLLVAWLLAACLKCSLVQTTVFLFLLGALLHWLFCVRVGA